MALPVNGSTHLIPALLLIYRPREDERLSWPSSPYQQCSGRFNHISGHPSAVGRAQDRESSPVRDRRSTTVPLPLQTTAFNTLYQLNIANVCGPREPKRLSESADSVAIGRLRFKECQLNTKKMNLIPSLGPK